MCECEDCKESDDPCACDCDRDDECRGCREARLNEEDERFEIDRAQGRA